MKKKEASEHARALSSLGASKGGKARMASLTEEQRKEIASNAAKARWGEKLPEVTHGDPGHPLKIGDIEIPCYVLNDGTRVLHQRGMVDALGMARGSSGGIGGDRLAKFVAGERLKPYVSADLLAVTESPIKFKAPNGHVAYGYDANVLAELCDAVIAARNAGKLQKQQAHIAEQCETLKSGFARVGIIALVDEATGYQYDRARTALADILEAFLKGALGAWAKRFDDDFYKELCRLRDIPWPPIKNLPSYFGHLVNDVVYDRLAPGLKSELQARSPKTPRGNRKNKMHQWLTDDIGHPKLKEHIIAVKALMRSCDDWEDFHRRLDRAFPKFDLSSLDLPENVIMIEAENKPEDS
jgi:hypothetical protein